MKIQKDLPELVNQGVISREVAESISRYYDAKRGTSTSRLFIVFGILGAILVGLGVILIIAHNWDELSRGVKTFFAFLPLVSGQALVGYVIWKKYNSVAWRESSSAFLFFAVGASISLVSQIYNIPGNLSSFLLTWALLCLPLVYVMKSSIASLLYLVGITYYAAETNYFTYISYSDSHDYLYWVLILGILPHYFISFRRRPESNFMIFHHWLVPLSLIITLGTLSNHNEKWMFVAYMSLFSLLYLIGSTGVFRSQKPMQNGYRILGSVGTIGLMLALSFNWFWLELRSHPIGFDEVVSSQEFYASLILIILASVLLFQNSKRPDGGVSIPLSVGYIVFTISFLLNPLFPVGQWAINIYLLVIGILTMRQGESKDHLGILNYGLLIITALVICRFFDSELSFVVRGLLFVGVGAGFFYANYRMIKRRKAHE